MKNQPAVSIIPPDTRSEHFLYLLLNNAEEILIMLDTDLKISLFNRTAALYSLNRSNIILYNGLSIFSIAPTYMHGRMSESYERVLSGETVVYEDTVLSKDEMYFHCVMKPAYGEDGSIQGIMTITRNETERYRAQKALVESEERWRFALEGSNQGVWDWNINTGECYFSRSYEKLYGFEPGEIRNNIQEWKSRIHPDDRQLLEEAVKRHLNSADPVFESTYRVKNKKGSYRWILARGMIVNHGTGGEPNRMIGTHTDITEAKTAEKQYRLLFESNPLPSLIYDLETLIILEVNEACVEFYGYTREEMLSMEVVSLSPPELVPHVIRHIRENKTNERAVLPACKQIKKNGDIIYGDVYGSSLNYYNYDARLLILHDITAKVKAEEKLKQSEQQYKTLFHANPLPCWIRDIHSGSFLEVNDAAIRHYGYTKEEFLSLSPADLCSCNSCEQSLSKKHCKKDGQVIFVEISSSSIQYNGTEATLEIINDVTARLEVEQELRISNERFNFAAIASSEALWEWNVVTGEAYVSQAYTDMLGWGIDTNNHFNEWHQYVHPDDREETVREYYDTVADPAQSRWVKEYRHLKADGTYASVIDKAVILRDEAGKAIKVIGALQDISEQKAVEEELKRSYARFHLASKATSDALYDWDLDNNELYWGDGLHALFGYQPSDVTITMWEELIHPDDRERVSQGLTYAIRHSRKKIWKEEYQYKHIDGTYRYVMDKGLIERDSEGRPRRLIGAMQDITDLKRKEQELISSNDRYRHATLATSDSIWDWDLKKNTVVWSENFTKIFGWPLGENRTSNIDFCISHFHPDDREKIKSGLEAFLNDPSRNIWQEEFRYQRFDGTYAFVSDRGYIIRNEEGKAVRIIGALQDITDRKYHEQMLSLERSIFELSANRTTSFYALLDKLLSGIECIHPETYTSVVLLREDGKLEQVAAPRIPPEIKQGLDGSGIGPMEGSCGSAMYFKKTVIVSDIEKDPLCARFRALAGRHAFRASWSLPIIHSSGEVMGSFAVYLKKTGAPTEKQLNIIERVRNIVRILMENHWAIIQIKTANERFDTVLKATHDLIWDWNLETNMIYRDAYGLKKVYGVEENQSIENIYQWLTRIHPEDQERVQAVINAILQANHEDAFDVEYRFLRDDGQYTFVYDRGKILRNEEGKPVRMIGAAQDITERKKLEQTLIQQELDRQKAINQATVDTQEQERSEIGKELHDNVNQVLTTTKLYLDLALSNNELKDELIFKSTRNIQNVINEIRQLSRSLMDPSIGDLGLVDSIHDLIESVNLTGKLNVSLSIDPRIEPLLSKAQKLTVFRIIQETLNNAIRHAKANLVIIKVKQHGGELQLVIEDNGVGFNPEKVRKGAGLKNIQNRVYLIDGTHTIQSIPGEGCKIFINFPITNNNVQN